MTMTVGFPKIRIERGMKLLASHELPFFGLIQSLTTTADAKIAGSEGKQTQQWKSTESTHATIKLLPSHIKMIMTVMCGVNAGLLSFVCGLTDYYICFEVMNEWRKPVVKIHYLIVILRDFYYITSRSPVVWIKQDFFLNLGSASSGDHHHFVIWFW